MTEEKPSDMVDEEKKPSEVKDEVQAEPVEVKPAEPTEVKPEEEVVLPIEKKPEVKTKQSFREKIWAYMAKEKLTNSYRSLCSRIPNFRGSAEATKRVTELDEFKDAQLVMISPDKPQESVIIAALQETKEVLIPKPRLLDGLFHRVKSAKDFTEEEAKNAVTRYAIKQLQTPVNFDTKDVKVDMLVIGSVCVNRAGYRIGVGEGFFDLEYAILSKMKAVNENAIIVTTVHDCQILDDLPNELFEPHDVPVDMIITPTQVVVVNPKLSRPSEIFWSKISERRLKNIPILKEIKEFEEKEGKILTLKDDDSYEEALVQVKKRVREMILKMRSKEKRTKSSPEKGKENDKNMGVNRQPYIRRTRLGKSKKDVDSNNSTESADVDGKKAALKNGRKPRQGRANWGRHQIDFSLRLSNIAASVRVRDLKQALLERGVKPSNITWRGQRGFCFLHFGKLRKRDSPENQPIQVDSIVANLQQLKIGDQTPEAPSAFITVEPAEPVSRIEVTDVTAV